mmetsp:Transcript_81783/g.263993  ORF Transcript_81783/g.263993 Transcript_81783/m.263993 type:complete len:133 (-) Transcript_81783:42-440(-)
MPQALAGAGDHHEVSDARQGEQETLCVNMIHCGDEASFNNEIRAAGDDLVVVDFTAVWCGACKRIQPELHELVREMPEVRFLEVDVDGNAAVANRFNITAMPTFMFFQRGELVGGYAGADIDELTMEIIGLK